MRAFTILAVALVAAAGCSGARRPTAQMAKADLAIHDADKTDAPDLAPLELRHARDKYEQAKRALDDDEYDRARRLAEQAVVDAQLAQAKADSEKAQRSAKQTHDSIDSLRREADRPAALEHDDNQRMDQRSNDGGGTR